MFIIENIYIRDLFILQAFEHINKYIFQVCIFVLNEILS